MQPFRLLFLLTALVGCTSVAVPTDSVDTYVPSDCVILLHGLARTSRSMGDLQAALESAGYLTVNNGYPSREAEIDALTSLAIPPAVTSCHAQGAQRISFVTHSLGGILLRYYLASEAHERPAELGRVVMLAPPNHGSEVVDGLRGVPGFKAFYGPAVIQLGTDADSIPLQLGPADFELGIITGQTANILSGMLPGEDDGSVTVESARLEGMTDYLVLDTGHTFIMNNDEVIRQTLFFLENGRFSVD
jgi:triacylglycerol lipase